MKKTDLNSYIISSSRFFALGAFMFFFSMVSWSAVYTSIADGSYNDCSIWDNGCPGNLIPVGDTVVINNVVGVSSPMTIRGVLIINGSGSLATSNYAEISETGTMINDGDFVCNAEFEINGYFYQSGLATIQYLHNDGYLCNSGTINISDRVFNHGGTIECDGNIYTCELDMENNISALAVTGSAGSSIAGQDVCCNAGGPSNPFDDLEDDWLIDSASVAICVLPLIPNAGDDGITSICNSAGSSIDLNTLLSENTGGVFSELTNSGSFDVATAVLNTDGLTSGDYNFIYVASGFNSTSDTSYFYISVAEVLTSSESISLCVNQLPYDWNGMSLTEAGEQTIVLSSSISGCDSIATLNLFVNAIPTSSTDTLVCGSQFPFTWNGSLIAIEGSQAVTLVSSFGCDSIATLNVSIEQLSTPIIDFSGPVSCPKDLVYFSVDEEPNAIYYWTGPQGFASNETSYEFELNQDMMGTYSVYYTLNSCVSEEVSIDLEIENIFDLIEFKFPNVITPNGDNVNDQIDIENYVGYCSDFLLTIRDRWGNEVFQQERSEPSFKGDSVDGRELPEGVYFYKFSYNEGDVSGFIHIVR
ncbi:MAG: gliding motility-associated C-terminal domain-containing protein [Crocinitomicaceae bacterium]